MTRPSHWILISLAVFGTVVTATGSWKRVFTGPRVDHWVQQRGSLAQRAVERGKPLELFGAVFDRRGRAVAGAEVRLVSNHERPGDETSTQDRGGDETTRTDENGRFALEVKGRRGGRLVASAAGFAKPAARVAAPGEPLFFVLEDATPWGAETGPQTGLAEKAVAERSLAAKTEAGRAAKPAGATADKSLLVGEGFLKDRDHNPVPFGQVAVRETGATVVADRTGRFQVPLPLVGEITLVASDRDGLVARSKSFRPSRGQGLVPVADLQLEPGVRLSGDVRDATGHSCDGAIVIATDGEIEHVAIADLRGRYRIDGCCAGTTYDVTVLPHRGRLGSTQRVTLDRSEERDLFVRATEDRRLRVLRGTTPVARAHVLARSGLSAAYGQADAGGWVDLPGFAPRELTASVSVQVRDETLTELAIRQFDGDVIWVE